MVNVIAMWLVHVSGVNMVNDKSKQFTTSRPQPRLCTSFTVEKNRRGAHRRAVSSDQALSL